MKIFTGGPILTLDRTRPRADAVAIDGERIVAVGDLDTARSLAPAAEEVDLAGACLLPGFIDAHHHFSEGALLTAELNLHWPAVATVTDILDQLRDTAARTAPGEWIIGEGYDERHLRERRAPTMDEIDRVCPHHPVVLVQFSYHEVVVNRRAHEVLGLRLDRPDPPGGEVERDRHGRPTGRMVENAAAPFYRAGVRSIVATGEQRCFARLVRYQERLFQAGITRVYDPAVPPDMERLLRRAAETGVLRVPVMMMPSSAEGMFLPPRDRLNGSRTGEGSELLRTGPLKLFMDGGVRCALQLPIGTALTGAFAALRRSLRRRSLDALRAARLTPLRADLAARCVRTGILFYTEAEAREMVQAGLDHGMAIAIHAEGNVAIDRALDVLPRSRTERATGVPPHRIEHFFLPDRDAIRRCAEQGIAVATQPTIAEWTGEQFLDMGLSGRQLFLPTRDLLDAGVTVAGSSDAPVVDFDPLRGIRCAVQRVTGNGEPLNDGQEVTILEALEMYTVHAARSAGLEAEVGTLAAGKRADLVVLDVDPTALRPHELGHLRVVRTIVGGQAMYERLGTS